MTFLSKLFTPTKNRRLNELVGFLLCVSALLLFLALASYSPLDPSLNSASILTGSRAARNWIGIFGAYLSDLILQFWGVGSFLLPIFMAMVGMRWFRSRAVQTPIAKTLGGIWLLLFVPALLAILPGHLHWMSAIPIEGLTGRIVGDFLIHYLNVAGAYIVCTTVLAVALYLTTAFSFSAIELWAPTRFAFVLALRDRFRDWQDARERKRQQKELEKRRADKPTITTQLVPARPAVVRSEVPRQEARGDHSDIEQHVVAQQIEQEIPGVQSATPAPRNGIERMLAEEGAAAAPQPAHAGDIEVTDRADAERKA
jgi:S-DNA-T family DNA segregation ATPase FtsK/SpoIIIE